MDEDDPDSQTLLVRYPTMTPLEGYVRQAIKIESEAKSAIDPNCKTTIRPYLADDTSLNLDIPDTTTVVAERTFWDKVIIIHGQRRWFERRGETTAPRPTRLAHYYHVYRLLDSEAGLRALADSALSYDCVRHARMFFDHPDFDLASAIPGTFALSPSPEMVDSLLRDYDRMTGMIMGTAPEFDNVIARIREYERRINVPA